MLTLVSGIKKKNAVSDNAGLRRIFFTFDRAVRRFPGDVKLWLQYVDFCKLSKSYRAVGRVYGRCVFRHPRIARRAHRFL